jgi:hypothetical protein
VATALAIGTPDQLSAHLVELAARARAGLTPVENEASPDLIEAAGYWSENAVEFLRARGVGIDDVSPWAIVAMIFSAGLVYE